VKLAIRRTYLGDRLSLAGVLPDRLVDLHAAYALRLQSGGLHREDALDRAARTLPTTLPALLQADPDLTIARELDEWTRSRSSSGELADECTWSAAGARLGPPTGRPRLVWGMTGNYPRSSNGSNPDGPRAMCGFVKAGSAIVGAHDPVRYPPVAERVEPEMELGVVIGRRARQLREADAMSAVAGYIGFVDIGSRDVSALDNNRMDRAKGFDSFGVIGPVFVTKDEISDPHGLGIRFWINDELTQDGNTSQMLHSIPEQLAWLTQALTLVPGDVLSTGSPPGVHPIRPGDRMRGEVEGLGAVECDVVTEPEPAVAPAN
jgi:5-oxopent-3-ene-1,2,5-tricarboxylate decarboxylase/2-hydroxyhepta-2,4-diene-1,7-dioate isomerase